MSKDEPASTTQIVIKPSTAAYADRMEAAMHACYGTTPGDGDQIFSAAMFRQHQAVFPDGQFIAVDTATDEVVGLTVSMRMHFDPHHKHTQDWWSSIGYG